MKKDVNGQVRQELPIQLFPALFWKARRLLLGLSSAMRPALPGFDARKPALVNLKSKNETVRPRPLGCVPDGPAVPPHWSRGRVARSGEASQRSFPPCCVRTRRSGCGVHPSDSNSVKRAAVG